MFRIRRVYDTLSPSNIEAIKKVKEIMRLQFASIPDTEISGLEEALRNPFKKRFKSILFVAEGIRNEVKGFALLLSEPTIKFCYLDWLAAASQKSGGGIGGALYERIRYEAVALGALGLFFECLPDDIGKCSDGKFLEQNRKRLKFYEKYGARPIINTDYDLPYKPGAQDMPYLVHDPLSLNLELEKVYVKKVIRAVLSRKYADICPPSYIKKVVSSVKDNPVRLRPYRYLNPAKVSASIHDDTLEKIPLVINRMHEIHAIHERGYVEAPVRISVIEKELDNTGIFSKKEASPFPDSWITSIHDAKLVKFLKRICHTAPEGKSIYPYIFPIRNKTRPPKEDSVLSGYYCIDTFTPLNRNAYPAAKAAVDCSLSAANEILDGHKIAYALVRPPGHHAERQVFGGFCYLNNNAVAANFLSRYGRVAILDLDYHHGNGQQDIFYGRSDVFTVSIHGHPSFAYPYFSGFSDEDGEGTGKGYNYNIPLPESVDGAVYSKALSKALRKIAEFKPAFLVVALGLDTSKSDPTGTWSLQARDFENNGRLIGELGIQTLAIQEGGYRTRTLGINTAAFFRGLYKTVNKKD